MLINLSFSATVVSYFLVLPPQLVSQTNTVALDFGSAMAGTTGGLIIAILVAFSCFGALNGQFYTSARLVFVAGREGYLPALFGRINPRTKTPIAATLLQSILVILFVLFGSGFASLVNFYGVCAWFFYFVTVLGLLHLRIKEPNLERPYQTWISTPILFSAVALFLLFMPIFSAPWEALAAFTFIACGIPMYAATQATGRQTVARIPGMSSIVAILQRCMGRSDNLVGRGANGGATDDVFGRRRVVRRSKSATSKLDDLDEEEEEGLVEETVEMLPRASIAASDSHKG
jgi:amino acid transporter